MQATPSALVINLPHLLNFPKGQGSAATPALRAIGGGGGWREVGLHGDRGTTSKLMTEAEMEQEAEKRQAWEESKKEGESGSEREKHQPYPCSLSLAPLFPHT